MLGSYIFLGLTLWIGAHFFRRLAPGPRASLGDAGKGVVAALVLAGLVSMILGYRAAEVVFVWSPPSFMVHINNTLMILAFWTFGSGQIKTGKIWPATKIRHPMLASVMIWAVGHLLVNGDLASMVLFGGLLVWAVASVQIINRAEPAWTPPAKAPAKKIVTLTIITLVTFSIAAVIHIWLGVWPFPT